MGVAIIILALFAAFVWWFSRSEASSDAYWIGRGLNIDHGHELSQRICLVCCAAAVCAIWVGWSALLLLPLGYGLFSWLFRWRLNSLRGRHRHYMAPWSNNYDRLWLAIIEWEWEDDAWLELRKDIYFATPHGRTALNIHRAGRLATTVEITVATIAAGAFLWVNYATR